VPEARDLDEMERRKSSTLNSMYIGTTISKPNVDSIINAVATILHSQMLEVGTNISNFRIWARTSRSPRIVSFFSFLRKSTFKKNPRLSTRRGSHCSGKRRPLSKYWISLRRFMTAPNSRKLIDLNCIVLSAASFVLSTSTD